MENKLQLTLTELSKGLLYPSESDYPFEYFEWDLPSDTPLNENIVRKATKSSQSTPVAIKTLDDFFKNVTEVKDWYGEEEKTAVQQYIALKQALEKELSDPRVYRLGEVEIDVYITGKKADGKWAGLKTKVVET